jgi:hypothetical protein
MESHIAKTLKSRQQWLPTGKDAESEEAQEHANSTAKTGDEVQVPDIR